MGFQPDSPVFRVHENGKLVIRSTLPLVDRESLSLAYTPGVAEVCLAIHEDERLARDYTWRARLVAVVSDGTAVLGLGNIGPLAALPVMEGKAALFSEFAGLNAVPVVLDTTDTNEIIETVARLAPSFGGINLEDISA
ncbi:MAG TPA: NAD-dependent malic enzyme, partial [Jatrophihabitantaceae bacterium]